MLLFLLLYIGIVYFILRVFRFCAKTDSRMRDTTDV